MGLPAGCSLVASALHFCRVWQTLLGNIHKKQSKPQQQSSVRCCMHCFNGNGLNDAARCFHGTCTGSPGPVTANLPGWRWAAITKVALDRLSRSLHSDVCDSDGCCDAVVHSTISGSGNRRTRAVPNLYQKSATNLSVLQC